MPPLRREGFWRAPKIWDRATCYILGGGPGLNNVDIERLRGQHVIAVNHAFQLAPFADAMFFNDKAFYMNHSTQLLDFAGMKVTTCKAEPVFSAPGIRVLHRENSPHGISRDPGFLTWNTSSGACAIGLAVHFGARKIILMGYDMRRIGSFCNWHEEQAGVPAPKAKDPYKRFLVPFPHIARDLKGLNIVCVNATPDSALTEFPIVTPDEVYPKESYRVMSLRKDETV